MNKEIKINLNMEDLKKLENKEEIYIVLDNFDRLMNNKKIIEIGKEIVKENNLKEVDNLFDKFFKLFYRNFEDCNENNFKELFNNEEILILRGKFWDIYADYLFD